MISPESLARQVQSAGFSCTRCGRCCQCHDEGSALVMVFPSEIRAIIAVTGLSWEEVAEPYPETIRNASGGRYTLGWCLKRNGGACRFLEDSRCTVYDSRPWICRTYPFMLDGDEIVISECDGLHQPTGEEEARRIAGDLICRREAEEAEAALIRAVLAKNTVPAGSFAVIDSDGMKVIDG
ncbi:MAG: Flagellin N-methylase [Methanoregula sp. PtaU1.Bin051]|nr:MAG: Flagellin N-methylase [Methanoregula sp. PtaU1.Bin051]